LVCCCAEEDEELRKALELSLQDIGGKFELSISNNLNRDNSTTPASPSGPSAAAADGDNNDNDDDNDNDDFSMSRYLDLSPNDNEEDDDFLSSNAFGVIKDVRVSNIVASDTDKISEFDAKNFKQLQNHHSDPVAAQVALLLSGAGGGSNDVWNYVWRWAVASNPL